MEQKQGLQELTAVTITGVNMLLLHTVLSDGSQYFNTG